MTSIDDNNELKNKEQAGVAVVTTTKDHDDEIKQVISTTTTTTTNDNDDDDDDDTFDEILIKKQCTLQLLFIEAICDEIFKYTIQPSDINTLSSQKNQLHIQDDDEFVLSNLYATLHYGKKLISILLYNIFIQLLIFYNKLLTFIILLISI